MLTVVIFIECATMADLDASGESCKKIGRRGLSGRERGGRGRQVLVENMDGNIFSKKKKKSVVAVEKIYDNQKTRAEDKMTYKINADR